MSVSKISRAALYIDGLGYLDTVKELPVPGPTFSVDEWSSLASIGKVSLQNMFDAMSMEIAWQNLDGDSRKTLSNPFAMRDLQVRYNRQSLGNSVLMQQIGGVYFMRGKFRGVPTAELTAGADMESSSTFDIFYIRHEEAGQAIYEYDPIAYIFKVNGVDMLATERANLGMV